MSAAGSSPAKIVVTCPKCGHQQREYAAAFSTVCQACSHRIPLTKKQALAKELKPTVERKIVECPHCGAEARIPLSVMSWQCGSCSQYMDFRDHLITSSIAQSVITFGIIHIGDKGRFTGEKGMAENITVSGKVESHLIARDTLILEGSPQIEGKIEGKHLIIREGAKVRLNAPAVFENIQVEPSEVRAVGVTASDQMTIHPGAQVEISTVKAGTFEVIEGAHFKGKFLSLYNSLSE